MKILLFITILYSPQISIILIEILLNFYHPNMLNGFTEIHQYYDIISTSIAGLIGLGYLNKVIDVRYPLTIIGLAFTTSMVTVIGLIFIGELMFSGAICVLLIFFLYIFNYMKLIHSKEKTKGV